jgi:hypothetical protein
VVVCRPRTERTPLRDQIPVAINPNIAWVLHRLRNCDLGPSWARTSIRALGKVS